MKYIVEIAKEYEEYFKGILICGIADGKFAVDVIAREDLEELTSDYINEHFADLQDEAYQEGYKACMSENDFDSPCTSCEAYQRGLNDAWEAAKKIVGYTNPEGLTVDALGKVFGTASYSCIVRDNTAQEAIDKIKAYEEQKADDEIKVGDEVEHTVSGYTSKAIFLEKINDDEDWYKCLFWTGCGVTILSYPKSQFKRTGRHFDIDKILEEMRDED